jgi:hypothetical protein
MTSDRKNAILTGILFIVAAFASIIGLLSYDPILKNPDYIIKGPTGENQIILGAIFELVTAVTVAGTAIVMFPFLRKHSERLALGYLCFRFFEAVLIVIGLISMLCILSLRQEFASAVNPDPASFHTSSKLLLAVHAWTFILGPNFMLGINTLMYSSVFFLTKYVPRPLAILGLMASICIFTAALLEMFGVFKQTSTWGILLALPIASYELSLAVYLIGKGFDVAALAAQSTKIEPTSQMATSPN